MGWVRVDGARGGCAFGGSILSDTDYLRLTIGYEMHNMMRGGGGGGRSCVLPLHVCEAVSLGSQSLHYRKSSGFFDKAVMAT